MKLTFFLRAFRRKKDLQDIHVMTLKLRPRAVSPHIRHSLGDTVTSSASLFLFFIIKKEAAKLW